MSTKPGSAVPWIAGGLAALAAAALFNQAAARKAERDHPPIGKFLEIDGTRVHYTDTGTGDPIVLIHGNASLVQDFHVAGLVDRLAATHRVIVFDRPGYGHTLRDGRDWTAEAQAALLAAASRQLGLVRPVVVGHSWGTLAAVAWALDFPGEVAALVLISGYYYPSVRVDAFSAGIVNVPLAGAVFTHAVAPLQTRLVGPLGIKMVFSPAEIPDAFTDGMPFGLMLRPSQLRASAEDGAQMPANAARLARRHDELRLPITVVWGEGDKLVRPAGESARFAAAVPTATGDAMPGLGHMLHHNRPDHVAAAILALARVPAPVAA